MASLQIETLALAHRYLWSQDPRDAIRTGEAAAQTVQDSIAVARMIDQAVQTALKTHAGAGFLPVALAATQSLAAEMPFTIEPRTGLPTGLPATLYAHYMELTGESSGPCDILRWHVTGFFSKPAAWSDRLGYDQTI